MLTWAHQASRWHDLGGEGPYQASLSEQYGGDLKVIGIEQLLSQQVLTVSQLQDTVATSQPEPILGEFKQAVASSHPYQ